MIFSRIQCALHKAHRGNHDNSQEVSPRADVARRTNIFSNHNNNKVNQLELDAAFNVTTGILLLLVTTVPGAAMYTASLVCPLLASQVGHCQDLSWVTSYVTLTHTLHSFYHPIIYMIRTRDFYQVLWKLVTMQRCRRHRFRMKV